MMINPGPLKLVEILDADGNSTRIWGAGIHFVHLDGVGIAPIRRFMTRAPLQHGMIDRGYKVDARRMTMMVYIEGNDPMHADGLRDRLATTFFPNAGLLTLRVTREDNEIRCIDCYLDGEMDFPTNERIGVGHPVIVPLIAPDPSFYDPTPIVDTTTLDTDPATLTIDITGVTWNDWPILEVTGEVDAGARIFWTQGLTSGVCDFEDGIPAGETWRFDTRPSSRSVIQLSDSSNKMPAFITSSEAGDGIQQMLKWKIVTLKERRAWGSTTATTMTVVFSSTGAHIGSSASLTWYRRFISL